MPDGAAGGHGACADTASAGPWRNLRCGCPAGGTPPGTRKTPRRTWRGCVHGGVSLCGLSVGPQPGGVCSPVNRGAAGCWLRPPRRPPHPWPPCPRGGARAASCLKSSAVRHSAPGELPLGGGVVVAVGGEPGRGLAVLPATTWAPLWRPAPAGCEHRLSSGSAPAFGKVSAGTADLRVTCVQLLPRPVCVRGYLHHAEPRGVGVP